MCHTTLRWLKEVALRMWSPHLGVHSCVPPAGKHHLPSSKVEKRLSSKSTQDRKQGQQKKAVKQDRSRGAVGGGGGKTHNGSRPFTVFQDELPGSTPESTGSSGPSRVDVKLGPTASSSGAAEYTTDTANQVLLHRARLVDDDASSGADDRTTRGTA